MAVTMNAAVMRRIGPLSESPVVWSEVPRPTAGPGELLLKVRAAGVCRSQLHMIEGDWAPACPPRLPIIPGHEIVGEVVEIGEGAAGFSHGQRVGVQPVYSTCGTCAFCVTGREQLCRRRQMTGESVDGGYAEYVLADAAYAYAVPDEIPDEEAAPLFCPGVTAYASVEKAHLSPGKKVAVFGMGGVGHLVVQFASLYGADVTVIARSKRHLELAEKLGAVPLPQTADVGATLAQLGGVDSAIVFAPSDEAVASAIEGTRPGGTIVLGADGSVGALAFPDEKAAVGTSLGTRQQMREVLDLAARGHVSVHSETFPLPDFAEALARLKAGELVARAVLVP
jgi:propanol-preferring alcohol dehydrogenase